MPSLDTRVDRPSTAISATSTGEGVGYMGAVRGVDICVVRTGEGHGPTSISTLADRSYTATSVTTGFPMYASTTIGDGLVLAAVIRSAPPGSRMCGIDLEPGMILVYGPEAEHTATNPAGTSFAFIVTPLDNLGSIAAEMHLDMVPPSSGSVHALARSPNSRRLGRELATHVESVRFGRRQYHARDDAVASLVAALAEPHRAERVGEHNGIDDRRVVHACIAWVEEVGRVPTILELLRVCHVSERRLRDAFVRVYGEPPMRFLRMWVLGMARRQLLQSQPLSADAVSRTATDLGFYHTGRFAAYYREQYGESPSVTVKQAKSALTGARAN